MNKYLVPDAILFGGFRVLAVEKDIKQPKYVSFVWSGKTAPLKVKVAGSNVKASALKWFEVRALLAQLIWI